MHHMGRMNPTEPRNPAGKLEPILSETVSQSRGLPDYRKTSLRDAWLLFLASFLALYFELVVIRFLSAEVRVFAYLKNLPLIASFLGLGVGMILGKPPRLWKRMFPFLAAALFLSTAYASNLHLTHVPFPNADYFVWGATQQGVHPFLEALRYFLTVSTVTAVVVTLFVVPGGIVGQYLALLPPLRGYGINLAGSFAGIALFTTLSFLNTPPVVWVLAGFLAAIPFFFRDRMALLVFAATLVAIGGPRPDNYWSPYYHISLEKMPPPPGWAMPATYVLSVNHDYHQKILDLSPGFVRRYPEVEPNRSALPSYELPFQLAKDKPEVLIVGSGTGNDVAAALRNGATHIDAVEIDPLILMLGRKYHPERPYESPLVTEHLGDARAYFKEAKRRRQTYDLVIFGYLDSHTLLTSLSSVRLDNYVYTVESFEEARTLLKDGGTLVLAFASARTFVTVRLYAMLTHIFGRPPHVYATGYDGDGVVFVEGKERQSSAAQGLRDIGADLVTMASKAQLATDRWPFLYLANRTIPTSILGVLVLFLWGCEGFLRRMKVLPSLRGRVPLHFLFLGAGFLLLETKAVTELSLLFGSTWTVNAFVIGTFLAAGFLANSLVMFRPISGRVAYAGLFVFLALGLAIPCSRLEGLSFPLKMLGAAVLVGFPVFFSGLVFSDSFAAVARPSEALGVNLLGAVVGGTMENLVMLWGVPSLGYLAILIYGLSAAFTRTNVSEVR